MKLKIILVAAAVVIIGVVIAGLLTKQPAVTEMSAHGNVAPPVNTPVTNASSGTVAPGPEISTSSETRPEPTQAKPDSSGVKPVGMAGAEPTIKINGYVLEDPMARIALSFVGSDPDADAYWIGAINDSAVPAEERKDLIEDLNEDGLSDPHHPSAQDMPLILARLQLIERLAPNAMDDVNRDAFKEAYGDLTDLLNGKEPK